jgi:predicted branched-subunit amino acid permease
MTVSHHTATPRRRERPRLGRRPSARGGRLATVRHGDGATRRALVDAVPISLGYLPYGLVLGATIAASELPQAAIRAATPLLFAGAAQLALIDLLEAGAAPLVVVATALVINLRLVMYGGAIAPWFQAAPLRTRLSAATLVIDPVYTMATARFPELTTAASRRRYWFALGGILWVVWNLEVVAGTFLGAVLPEAVPLDRAVPLTFLAMLAPMLTSRGSRVAAAAAATTAIAANAIPLHLGVIVGAITGVALGALDAGFRKGTP